jgi:hypothetical protein
MDARVKPAHDENWDGEMLLPDFALAKSGLVCGDE